jgi:NADH-quinone oxidoreductase subunit A
VPSDKPHEVQMPDLLIDYFPVLMMFGIALVLSLAFLLVPAIIAPADPDAEKVSAYECGFEAFDDSRMKFDVRFYLVAILFIIFDIEVAFLFPIAVSLDVVGVYGWVIMTIFLLELLAGLVYAWKIGALDWE